MQPWCKDNTDTDLVPLPTACNKNWCYIDKDACDQSDVTLSDLFGSDLYYSQKTCGDEYNFSAYITNASKTSSELMTIVND